MTNDGGLDWCCTILGTMFVQVFETVDYLTFHLPWGLEIFTDSVFMYEICCLKIIERDSKICVLGT